jgi:hypothetical protein
LIEGVFAVKRPSFSIFVTILSDGRKKSYFRNVHPAKAPEKRRR